MPVYIEYNIDEDTTLLVEAESSMGGVVKASRGGVDLIKTGKSFTEAWASARGSLKALIAEMDALSVEEAEVKFGLKAVGEAGVFAVGKVGGEMNYEVTLKWKKPQRKANMRMKKAGQ